MDSRHDPGPRGAEALTPPPDPPAAGGDGPERSGPEISVVVPVYDEGDGVVECLEAIRDAVVGLDVSYEIVVVDDGSPEATWEALVKLAARADGDVGLVRLSRNFGKESAVCAGLDRARGAAVVVMDADLQHPPSLLPEMVRLWREGADVVEAVKVRRQQEPWVDRVGSWLFYATLRRLGRIPLDGASDYKLLTRRALTAWRRFGESETFFRGLVHWMGFRRAQVSFEVPLRHRGRSRWTTLQRVRLAVRAITSFTSLPLQLITTAGLILLVLTGLVGVDAILTRLDGEAVPGFTTVIVLQGLVGSTIMISLGIIGLYLARIYEEVKARPRYLVREDRPPASSRP